jgi:hypothetical protein
MYSLMKLIVPERITEINYSRTEIELWQYVILPNCWISLYTDDHAKNETTQKN